MKLTDLARAVKKSGLKVVEVDGWQRRGHGELEKVQSVVCHHTAGPAQGNMPSLDVVTHGRGDLSGPLCNLALGRDGTVYVVAAGVAYHAGKVGQTTYDNWHSIGIEAEATGTSKWPTKQMAAYALLCKTLCEHYEISIKNVRGHKEVAVPKGRKIDPNFDMNAFRARVVNAGKDWLEMATQKQVEDLVRKVVREEVGQAVLDALVNDPNHPHGPNKPRKLSGTLVDMQRDLIAIRKEVEK